jgi:hypothetical protein
MRTLTLLALIAVLTTACNKKSSAQGSGFTANVRIVTPFAGTLNGKLYLSKRRLRVDLGQMSDVYDSNQEKGCERYLNPILPPGVGSGKLLA